MDLSDVLIQTHVFRDPYFNSGLSINRVWRILNMHLLRYTSFAREVTPICHLATNHQVTNVIYRKTATCDCI